MDILLTHGYFLAEDPAEARIMKPYPPLGILSIAAYLKAKGFDARVHDTTFGTFSAFEDFVARVRPPVVGISANLMTKRNVVRQIRASKRAGASVIVGGPDVPQYAEEYLRCGADAAVLGEGEEAAAELLPLLARGTPPAGIAGIAYLSPEGKAIRTAPRPLIPSLDALPLPDREAIDIGRYLDAWRTHHGRSSLSLICARGCPYSCTWCSRSVYGETHRRRSPERVVDEIEELRARYAPDMLWFADDVFTINFPWFHRFHAEMTRRRIRIPFECITRADRLNEEILRKMAELGAFRIWYGSESGSQRILDAMERRVTAGEIRSVTKLARRFGIEAGLFVMLGYPGEEIADIRETVEHLRAAGADTFLTTLAYPIRGTPYYDAVAGSLLPRPGPWETTTDRETTYAGRHSRKFYWFAQRYLVNAVRQPQLRRAGRYAGMAAAFCKARVARVGMWLTARGRT